jgi:hypothetical protein
MRISFLRKRYAMVWDEVYHGTMADCVQAIAPSKWSKAVLERIAYNAAAFAVCVHHRQWPVSAVSYPSQARRYKGMSGLQQTTRKG